MKIDLHAHFNPREFCNVADESGKIVSFAVNIDDKGQECLSLDGTYCGPIGRLLYDPEARIKAMDKIGLDMQAICVSPATFFYYFDDKKGLDYAKKQNDCLAQWITAYPDRFVGIATVPMQNINNAIVELERAVTQLGFRGVEINTNIKGKNLDEPEFLPFFAKAQALDVPVFLHPHYVVGAKERLNRHYMVNLVGNPTDTTIAVASLVLGGVLEKLPRLKIVGAHAGGASPFIKGRWDHGYSHLYGTKINLSQPPSEYVKMMYFDTITHYKPALMYMINDHGIDHIVMGSDYPFDMGDVDPVSVVKELGLSSRKEEKILWKNAAALLKL